MTDDNQQDIDPEISDLINEHFWELTTAGQSLPVPPEGLNPAQQALQDSILSCCSVMGLDNSGDGDADLWEFNRGQLLGIIKAAQRYALEQQIEAVRKVLYMGWCIPEMEVQVQDYLTKLNQQLAAIDKEEA